MKRLAISNELALPLDTITSTLVVYGGKGMGKTNLASVLVEEIAANGLRFAFLDPVGVSWGLRHSVDGKGRGIELLILGGIHGDIPIEPTGGAVVADLVVDESVNVLIDISRHPNGSMWSIGERVRFVTDYCKRLYQRQGEKRHPIMQVIDEAARFAPQIVRKGDDQVSSCMGAIAVLVEEGRNVGIGVTLLTLRSARLNKDVAELADCMIAFRTVGPNSRAAVLDWLGAYVDKDRLRELDSTVRTLPVGSALIVSPGWLEFEGVIALRARRTFDSSKTPKPGEQVRATGQGAKPDLAKYQAQMAATIERAKENDPKELRQRIKELERAAGQAKPVKLTNATAYDLERAKSEGKREERAAWKPRWSELETVAREDRSRFERLRRIFGKVSSPFGDLAKELAIELSPIPEMPKETVAVAPLRQTEPRAAAVVRQVRQRPAVSNGGDLGKGERTILTVLAQYPHGKSKRAIGTLSGYSSSGGSFAAYLSRLRSKGLIEGSDPIVINDAGLSALGEFEPIPRGEDLQAFWLSRLGKGEAAILRVLLDHHGSDLSREEVARLAGYEASGGSFAAYLSRLRTKEVIDAREMRASEAFFE